MMSSRGHLAAQDDRYNFQASSSPLTMDALISWLTFQNRWPYYGPIMGIIPKQCKDSEVVSVSLSSTDVWSVIYSPATVTMATL